MTQPASPVLVTGATGNTGRAVAEALARRGTPVRAMVRAEADRDRLPAGVQSVVADFDDPASIAAALHGARRAYLVTPRRSVPRHSSGASQTWPSRLVSVTFIDVRPDVFAESLQGILPPWQIQGLLEDYAHYRRGEAASVSTAVAEITGKPATDVKQFAHDYALAFAV